MKIPKSDKSLRFCVICKECQQKGRLAMFTLNSDLLLLNKICSSGEHRIKAQDKCAILNEQRVKNKVYTFGIKDGKLDKLLYFHLQKQFETLDFQKKMLNVKPT